MRIAPDWLSYWLRSVGGDKVKAATPRRPFSRVPSFFCKPRRILVLGRRAQVLISNGWTLVESSQCWEYRGRRNKGGYGAHGSEGMHRVAFRFWHGPIAPGMVVRHTCDNPPCVNPGHLIIGTRADNVADMIERGRHYHQRATHCPQGHPYDDENTIVRASGARGCRICQRETIRRWRATPHGRAVRSAESRRRRQRLKSGQVC